MTGGRLPLPTVHRKRKTTTLRTRMKRRVRIRHSSLIFGVCQLRATPTTIEETESSSRNRCSTPASPVMAVRLSGSPSPVVRPIRADKRTRSRRSLWTAPTLAWRSRRSPTRAGGSVYSKRRGRARRGGLRSRDSPGRIGLRGGTPIPAIPPRHSSRRSESFPNHAIKSSHRRSCRCLRLLEVCRRRSSTDRTVCRLSCRRNRSGIGSRVGGRPRTAPASPGLLAARPPAAAPLQRPPTGGILIANASSVQPRRGTKRFRSGTDAQHASP